MIDRIRRVWRDANERRLAAREAAHGRDATTGSGSMGVDGGRWTVSRTVSLVLLVAVPLAARWASGTSDVNAWGANAIADVPFVAHAAGSVVQDAELSDSPTGGTTLATVPAGSLVDVGGVVRGSSGIWSTDVYWVRVTSSVGAREGFVRASSVRLTAGVPPSLSLAEVDDSLQLVVDGPGDDAPWAAAALEVQQGSRASSGTGVGNVGIPWLPETVAQWSDGIVVAAARYGVDPDLLAILVLVESGGDPGAGSHVGARGLTQVMPATGASIAAERGLEAFSADQLWQPDTALDFGAYYLAQQLRSFGSADDPDWQQSVERAAAAYNGGPGAVLSGRYAAETKSYVRWVGGMWRERKRAESDTFGAWMAAGGRHLVDAARQRMVYKGGGAPS